MRRRVGVLLVAASGCNALTGLSDNDYDRQETPVCAPGYVDCDGQADNGCEANIESDANHCGQSCVPCPIAGDSYPVCVAGQCTIVCNSGFADCDGEAANGCEVALDKDPESCAACGRSCEGGECQLGKCQPVQVASVSGGITGLGISGGSVVLATSDGELARVPLDGGAKVTMLFEPPNVFTNLVVAGTRALWFTPSAGGLDPAYCMFEPDFQVISLRAIDVESAAITPIESSTDCYSGLGADEAFAYVSRFRYDPASTKNFHEVRRLDPLGVVTEVGAFLESDLRNGVEASLVADDQALFWATGGVIHRLPKDFSGLPVVFEADARAPLLVDDEHLFFRRSGDLHRIPTSGGAAEQVVNGFNGVVTTDADSLFWWTDAGVWRARKDGTDASVVAANVSAYYLAARDGRLFFASTDTLYKLVLPTL